MTKQGHSMSNVQVDAVPGTAFAMHGFKTSHKIADPLAADHLIT